MTIVALMLASKTQTPDEPGNVRGMNEPRIETSFELKEAERS
jgi:hypothetical protein